MATPFEVLEEEFMKRPDAEELLEEAEREHQTELALYELRKKLAKTQAELAEILGVSQGAISQMEKSVAIKIPSLTQYVEALGGRLEVSAVFEDDDNDVVYPLSL